MFVPKTATLQLGTRPPALAIVLRFKPLPNVVVVLQFKRQRNPPIVLKFKNGHPCIVGAPVRTIFTRSVIQDPHRSAIQ